ncbi:MAG: PqqD family protein [Candidatus Saganbacteria bacterium]|nr:PqqD family protein [Candidatus Saganbacteria bacterium]
MKKILANKDFVYREEEDEALIFNPDNGGIKILNATGNLIWKLCDGTRDKEQIIRELMQAFPDVNKKVLKQDLDEFLAKAKKTAVISYVS